MESTIFLRQLYDLSVEIDIQILTFEGRFDVRLLGCVERVDGNPERKILFKSLEFTDYRFFEMISDLSVRE